MSDSESSRVWSESVTLCGLTRNEGDYLFEVKFDSTPVADNLLGLWDPEKMVIDEIRDQGYAFGYFVHLPVIIAGNL
ncbi:hypothetical protein DPMN_059374 [Dreissena polymorpha]|uniref:Uncharacterized protein n=1 Tax=Dreissena polymorpha TaxID=45954 RepID=A0A9D4C3E2_DREPO|nr:hypothetical protein DPMN_059374 [Dreissena polymorpha]